MNIYEGLSPEVVAELLSLPDDDIPRCFQFAIKRLPEGPAKDRVLSVLFLEMVKREAAKE